MIDSSAWLNLVAAANKVCCLVQEIAWRRIESYSNNDVEAEEHGAFEVVRFAVLNGIRYDQNRHGESNSFDYIMVSISLCNTRKFHKISRIVILTSLKVECHVTSNNPTNNNEEWSDTKGNLDTRTNGYTHGQVHLVAESDHHGSDVFRRVSNNGDQDQTDKCLADIRAFDDVIDGSNQVIGTDGNQNRHNDEDYGGSNRAKSRIFRILALGELAFSIKEVAVSAKLEYQVEGV